MAHYALLNENNEVVQIITGVDEQIVQTNTDGNQIGGSTEAWEEFYASCPWLNAFSCKRTSYNENIRKRYAVIGYTYDEIRDAFIPSKPHPSWILNEDTCNWEAPVAHPVFDEENPRYYEWNEEILNWEEIQVSE